MSLYESIEDFFDEDAKFDRAYDNGFSAGEVAAEDEQLGQYYAAGYDDGFDADGGDDEDGGPDEAS